MKSYMEIAVEFSSLEFEEKNDYLLNVLSLEELKLFGEGFYGSTSGWNEHIDYVYKKRVSENRNNKLDQLGI